MRTERAITVERFKGCDWSLFLFITSNFSNQIFRKDFVCIHYHLCEILNELKLTIMIFISVDLIIIYKLINLKII